MPTKEELARREKAMCGRCGKMAKHRARECYVELQGRQADAIAQGGPGDVPSSSSSNDFFYSYLNE